nr:type-F conjugative transfer system protein TraW [Solimonas sp. SE-A11]
MWAGSIKAASLAVLFACCSASIAEDLGAVGPTWPIQERDLVQVMQERAAVKQRSGEIEQLQGALQKRAKAYADRPTRLGLARAAQVRSWTLDPAVSVPYDIKDASGKVLIPAGTRVNPLDRMALSRKLVFLDADDPEQLAWLGRRAAVFRDRHKVILTGGSISQATEILGGRVWFDQTGKLVQEFGIKAVPAIVAQDGRLLRIQEIPPGK